MQLKMQDLLGFTNFHETVKDKKIPIKTAYKLAKLSNAIEKEVVFYQEKLKEIIMEYAELNSDGVPTQTEDGQGIKIQKGREEECTKAIVDLQEIEVNLPDIVFTLEEFNDLELTFVELGYALPFISE